MKLAKLGLWAASAMAVTAGITYVVTPDGGAAAPSSTALVASVDRAREAVGDASPDAPSRSRFHTGSSVLVDARLGRAVGVRGAPGENYLLVELRGGDVAARASAPVHLGLVIDRSGSMQGKRIQNALSAATSAIERLRDGDSVSVVAFDTQALVVVQPTVLDASNRADIEARVRAIQLGGDTCISCGMDAEMALESQTPGRIERMIVLSDGDTNNGVRDADGLRKLAEGARSRGVTVTSIGVDLAYNERIMAALAEGGDGRHYFVQRPDDLGRVFESEAGALEATVASSVEASFDLSPGVELLEVHDRTFVQRGSRVVVPVGSLSKDEVKTVLLRVRTPAPVADPSSIAHVSVAFDDRTTGQPGRLEGDLAELAGDRASPLDPFVEIRVDKSTTADTLEQANELFRQGNVAAAQAKIAEQKKRVAAFAEANDHAANDPFGGRGGDAVTDSRGQLDSLAKAEKGFATPPPAPAPRPGRAAPEPDNPFAEAPAASLKDNQAAATEQRR